MNNYIKINHLTSIDLYNNLNLIVPLNKFITITGPNNSGKSTLLKLLNKDIDIENTIFINNKDISKYTYKEYYKLTKLISVDNLLFNKSNIYQLLLSSYSYILGNPSAPTCSACCGSATFPSPSWTPSNSSESFNPFC